jgi:site-specific DNA-methyltransferase (adenine-specific)
MSSYRLGNVPAKNDSFEYWFHHYYCRPKEKGKMERFLGKVFNSDALRLLRELPPSSIDTIISDPMYGTSKSFRYDWGADPARGDAVKHWLYHKPIYDECRRALKPGGILAWAQGAKFFSHFRDWFGGHRVWSLARFRMAGPMSTAQTWIVQSKEQEPIEFPKMDSLVVYDDLNLRLMDEHPCIKPIEELAFLINALTSPGDIVCDCCCGLGSTLVAAKMLGRRWIGCDLSKRYCQIAMRRLAELDVQPRIVNLPLLDITDGSGANQV